jgi:multimeric flavodoxin WrbA
MQGILPKLLAGDAIVLGTPGYMGRLSGDGWNGSGDNWP